MTERGPAWEDPRRALRRHDLRASRSHSQNFLVHHPTVERIADAVPPGGDVVELGPGLGTLTAALLRRSYRVVALEKDPRMVEVLQTDFKAYADRLTLVAGNATSCRFAELAAPPVRVVGNLPYAVTGGILRNLVGQRRSIHSAVVMVQREVRDRLLARPGSKTYGALSVFTQAAFDLERVLDVGAGSFFPAPKVASAVVRLTPRAVPLEETELFRTVVRGAFEARRKTLTNALKRALPDRPPDSIAAALHELGVEGSRRGETLSPQQFHALAELLAR